MNINELSAHECDLIAARLTQRAKDLRAAQPSYGLALAAGVRDNSYSTVRYGTVADYSGTAEVTLDDGSRWLAVGHGPRGSAEHVSRDGYIDFQPLPTPPTRR